MERTSEDSKQNLFGVADEFTQRRDWSRASGNRDDRSIHRGPPALVINIHIAQSTQRSRWYPMTMTMHWALFLLCSFPACGLAPQTSQQPEVRVLTNLYQCEGCEGALERAADTLAWSTTMPQEGERGDPFVFEGVVYQINGKRPASGVVLYAYQTNADGLYANGTSETQASRRHGRLRAWVKTGADGKYKIRSIKPSPYPNDTIPAHVHITVLEPGRKPYWIDDIVFDGEFGVTNEYRRAMINKGGSGIVKATRLPSGEWHVTRDILLERHP
jgi:protocatechuate 3,4-dioxygenase, beta subunit